MYILCVSSWWNMNIGQKFLFMRHPDMLSFVFVRHPYERLESAYFDKIVGNAANESKWWEFMVNSIRQKCKWLVIKRNAVYIWIWKYLQITQPLPMHLFNSSLMKTKTNVILTKSMNIGDLKLLRVHIAFLVTKFTGGMRL